MNVIQKSLSLTIIFVESHIISIHIRIHRVASRGRACGDLSVSDDNVFGNSVTVTIPLKIGENVTGVTIERNTDFSLFIIDNDGKEEVQYRGIEKRWGTNLLWHILHADAFIEHDNEQLDACTQVW